MVLNANGSNERLDHFVTAATARSRAANWGLEAGAPDDAKHARNPSEATHA
jgi:hypothetical protein